MGALHGLDPWQARFGWIWFNEKEIFDSSQEDIDRHVKTFADQGINILIGFSCTHFRMSFRENWREINACIARYAKACHKFGMLYVEHHSCHLVWHPLTPQEKTFVAAFFRGNHSDPARFAGFPEGMRGDSSFGQFRMSDFYQVSGATGEWGRTWYSGYGMCFNNPHYREVYFRYLEDVFRCGIDGLMTDDVQFFGNDDRGRWNACTCEHCRRLFREETGFELPGPDQWDSFYGNFSDPVFVAWKKFKAESTVRFQRDVTAFFRSKGYDFLRPNYISSILEGNITAYPFEQCADLWDFIFQENCYSDVIRASYPRHAMEAVHRFAMARSRGVPSMSMFYPCTQSAVNFSFALAKAWGQLYTRSKPCIEGEPLGEAELRAFEKRNLRAFSHPKKMADLAFLLSVSTRDYTARGKENAGRMLAWMESAYLSGLACDMVFEWDPTETMKQFRTIMAVGCEMLGDETLANLLNFVRAGGTLLIAGDFASRKADGSSGISRTEGFVPSEPGRISLGEGTVLRLSDEACAKNYVRVLPQKDFTVPSKAQEPAADGLRASGGKALRAVLPDRVYDCSCAGELFCSVFENDEGEAVHLVNTDRILPEAGDASHTDPIPQFCAGAAPVGEVALRVKCAFRPEKAVLVTPERSGETPLDASFDGTDVRLTVPAGCFAGYAVVRLLKPAGR